MYLYSVQSLRFNGFLLQQVVLVPPKPVGKIAEDFESTKRMFS